MVSSRALAIFFIVTILIAITLLLAPKAGAASGTWNSTVSGNWSDTTKWTSGIIADGAGSTGNFTTNNLNPGITVTIDTTSRTLGILNIGDTNRSDPYNITSSGGATLTLNNSGVASQINFVATGGGDTISAPLIIGGTAGLTITSSNTNQAKTNVISGGITSTGTNSSLTITNNQALTGQMQFTTSSINNSGTLTLNGTSGTATTLISGGIGSNVTNLSNTSANIVTISTTAVGNTGTIGNTGSGNFTISSNINSTVTNITLGATGSATQTLSGATINNTGTITNNGTTSGATTISGAIGSNVTGVTQNSATSALVLSGANTYVGNTTITAGTLRLGAANVIPDGSGKGNVSVSGTLDLNTFSETINGLSGAGTVDTVAGGTPTLTVGNNNQTSSFSGVIKNTAGTLALTKTGTGTLTLSGANTYSGATTINAGTLSLDNAGSSTPRLANTSNITVNSGGTLLLASSSGASTDRINNSATVTLNGGKINTGGLSEGNTGAAGVGALTLQDNSIIDLGTGASILHFAASNAATWTASKILEIDNWSGSQSGGGTDQLIFGTTSSGLTAGQIAEIQFLNPDGFSAGTYGATILANGEIVPIPEPGTWVAGGLAFATFLFRQRRRFARILKRA